MAEAEIWKQIEKVDGPYFISNFGRVKNSKGRIMKCRNNVGYRRIDIGPKANRQGFQVHCLVANAFLEKGAGETEVNHLNGKKTDNRLVNLKWSSHSENVKHAFDVLNRKPPNAIEVIRLSPEGLFLNSYRSLQAAAEELNLSRERILISYMQLRAIRSALEEFQIKFNDFFNRQSALQIMYGGSFWVGC